MDFAFTTLFITLGLFLAILLLEIGRRIGNRRLANDAEGARSPGQTP